MFTSRSRQYSAAYFALPEGREIAAFRKQGSGGRWLVSVRFCLKRTSMLSSPHHIHNLASKAHARTHRTPFPCRPSSLPHPNKPGSGTRREPISQPPHPHVLVERPGLGKGIVGKESQDSPHVTCARLSPIAPPLIDSPSPNADLFRNVPLQ